MNKVVFGMVNTRSQAADAVAKLRASGTSESDIAVIIADHTGARDFAFEHHTRAAKGAAMGAAVGGLVAAAIGFLIGTGTISIVGLGSLIAAGPIFAALSAASVGAALLGVIGALIGLRFPAIEAKAYSGPVDRGSVLLAVHAETGDQVHRVKESLARSGATGVFTSNEASPSSKHSVPSEMRS
ncbi:MAG: DUF3341 domain-containing protein [Sandaracinaceae bacterium]|nr:DUF3341 domain-containing protein [Sandaracinaceae bacterium]